MRGHSKSFGGPSKERDEDLNEDSTSNSTRKTVVGASPKIMMALSDVDSSVLLRANYAGLDTSGGHKIGPVEKKLQTALEQQHVVELVVEKQQDKLMDLRSQIEDFEIILNKMQADHNQDVQNKLRPLLFVLGELSTQVTELLTACESVAQKTKDLTKTETVLIDQEHESMKEDKAVPTRSSFSEQTTEIENTSRKLLSDVAENLTARVSQAAAQLESFRQLLNDSKHLGAEVAKATRSSRSSLSKAAGVRVLVLRFRRSGLTDRAGFDALEILVKSKSTTWSVVRTITQFKELVSKVRNLHPNDTPDLLRTVKISPIPSSASEADISSAISTYTQVLQQLLTVGDSDVICSFLVGTFGDILSWQTKHNTTKSTTATADRIDSPKAVIANLGDRKKEALPIIVNMSSAEMKQENDKKLHYVSFIIEVHCGEASWFVSRRYRHFRELHSALRDKYGRLPELPKTNLTRTTTPEYLELKQARLGAYLTALLSIPELAHSDELCSFLVGSFGDIFSIDSRRPLASDDDRDSAAGGSGSDVDSIGGGGAGANVAPTMQQAAMCCPLCKSSFSQMQWTRHGVVCRRWQELTKRLKKPKGGNSMTHLMGATVGMFSKEDSKRKAKVSSLLEEIVGYEAPTWDEALLKRIESTFTNPKSLSTLISFLTLEPGVDATPADISRRLKYPFIACKILTNKAITKLADMVLSEPTLLDAYLTLFWYPPPLDSTLLDYFVKVVNVFIRGPKRHSHLLSHLDSMSEDILSQLLLHIGNATVLDLMLDLFVRPWEEDNLGKSRIPENSSVPGSSHEKFIARLPLIAAQHLKHHADDDDCTNTNLLLLLQELIEHPLAVPNSPLFQNLHSLEVAERLMLYTVPVQRAHHSNARGGGGMEPEKVVVTDGLQCTISLILSLNRIRLSPSPRTGGLARRQSLSYDDTAAILSAAIRQMHYFHSLLLAPLNNQNEGEPPPPFGSIRLQVLKLIVAMQNVGSDVVDETLVSLGIIRTCLELFFTYMWHNILHSEVCNLVVRILQQCSPPVITYLFVDCRLVDRILQSEKENAISLAAPKGCRLGYMGHLYVIANEILQTIERSGFVSDFLRDHVGWQDYVSTSLTQQNQMRALPLGGQPPKRVMDDMSMSEIEAIDVDSLDVDRLDGLQARTPSE